MPFPWTDVTYKEHVYSMSHLADVRLRVLTENAPVACTVKFSFHCFTDHAREQGEDRPRIVDPDSGETDRVFCPQRWSWSHFLPGIAKRLGAFRVHDEGADFRLAAYLDVGPAFAGPYAIHFDVAQVVNNATIIHVNSAFVLERSAPAGLGGRPKLSALIRDAARTGKRPGTR